MARPAASAAAADPPIDCFYVYPTVSRDPGLNSDMNAGHRGAGRRRGPVRPLRRASAGPSRRSTARRRSAASRAMLRGQRSGADLRPRLWRRARRLAPLSRASQQWPAVRPDRPQPGHDPPDPPARGGDRGPAGRRAHALGAADRLQCRGARRAGHRRHLPHDAALHPRRPDRLRRHLCLVPRRGAAARRAPCSAAPPAPGRTIACTNPAALGSDASAPLDSLLVRRLVGASRRATSPGRRQGPPPTPFLRTEGLVSAACVHRRPARLSRGHASTPIPPTRAPTGSRATSCIGGMPAPGWGIHLVDVNIAQGDLIRVVEAQRAACRRRAPPLGPDAKSARLVRCVVPRGSRRAPGPVDARR